MGEVDKKFLYTPRGKKFPKLMDFDRANKLLQDLKKVFDELNIPFFLFCGTLLGAMREKNFIYHDSDVDVAVLVKDARNYSLSDMGKKFRDLGYSIMPGPRVKGILFNFYIQDMKYHEKVDVYTLFPWGEYQTFPRPYIRKNKPYEYSLIPFPEKHFRKFDTIDFLGAEYNIPHDSKELLKFQWGKWWIIGGGQFGLMKTIILGKEEFESIL